MNTNKRRVPTKFAPEIRFELEPVAAAPYRAVQDKELERLKSRLLGDWLGEALDPQLNNHLFRAANEAAALAWVTCYPLLLFPMLFEEKARAALNRAERQEQVRQLSRELLAV